MFIVGGLRTNEERSDVRASFGVGVVLIGLLKRITSGEQRSIQSVRFYLTVCEQLTDFNRFPAALVGE
jgi:hypothetical protein